MSVKNEFYFLRMFRTESSEVWIIDFKKRRVGYIHLHFSKSTTIYGDAIFFVPLNTEELNAILNSTDEWLASTIEPREDFIFSVYMGTEIDSYSDHVNHDEFAPTRKDLKEHGALIKKLISKHQNTRGQLNEHVVKDYLKKLGFESTRGGSVLDAMKIDVIAHDEERVIYCQVKLGKVDNRVIHDVCKSVSNIDSIDGKRKVVSIVANSFPQNIELIKEDLESKFNMRIWTILKSQILNELPEYKKTLS